MSRLLTDTVYEVILIFVLFFVQRIIKLFRLGLLVNSPSLPFLRSSMSFVLSHSFLLLSLPVQCGWSAGSSSSRAEPALHFNAQCCPAPFFSPPNPDIWLWLLYQWTEPWNTPGQTAFLPGAAHCRWAPARQLPHLLQRAHFAHRRLGSYRLVLVGKKHI